MHVCGLSRIAIRGRGRGAAGVRGGRGYAGGFGRGATSFRKPLEHRFIELQPNMELIPTNPFTLKPMRTPVQILYDVCEKNNWGEPVFELLSHFQNSSGIMQNSYLLTRLQYLVYLDNIIIFREINCAHILKEQSK
ncbi:APOBEC1 complementation factor-like [Centruroides vittatus]|uniref:APOBEC1 complementation factor-like n=1 Tax=Centruroides vittatus TaxID=120091 RepID=UPI00350EB042